MFLIAAAYNVPFQSSRLTGGPDWIRVPPPLPAPSRPTLPARRSMLAFAPCCRQCSRSASSWSSGTRRARARSTVDLDDIAVFVSNWTVLPVVNRTGLAGLFTVDTEGWVPMQPRPPRTDGSPAPEAQTFADPWRPTVFMIFIRLGLNLESSKGGETTPINADGKQTYPRSSAFIGRPACLFQPLVRSLLLDFRLDRFELFAGLGPLTLRR